MNLETGATLGQLVLAIVTTMLAGGIAWGSLLQRVRALEKQVEGLPEVSNRLTRVETIVDGIQGDVVEIKADMKTALQELRTFGLGREPRGRN